MIKLYKKLDKDALIIVLTTLLLISIFLDYEIKKLYEVQTEIIIHDYGQTFETIEDWKLWRIEQNKKFIEGI